METLYEIKDDTLTIFTPKEIDHHAASIIIEYSDVFMSRNNIRNMVFDFESTDFMDSSGIGVVIERYKIISKLGGKLVLRNMKKNVERMFEISGVKKMLEERR